MSGLSCLCDKYSWCIKSDKFASLECVRNVELSAGIIYHATQARTICTNFIASESQHSGFYNIFGSGTAESPISHLVRTATATATAAARVQQILNHVIG